MYKSNMARSLADTIGTDFLTCAICLESYKYPRTLPCHHGFCSECLQSCVASSKDKQTLVCPTCRQLVKISVAGVKELPVHFLVESLKDAVEMDKQVKNPSHNTVCDNCDVSTNKATVRCIDCKQYLCDECYGPHKFLKTMKGHTVVSMEDILSGKADLRAAEEAICEEHNEPHKYYCKDENKPICQDCVALKTCPMEHDRITIDKAVQEKSKELEDLVIRNDEILKKYQDSVKQVDVTEKELQINFNIAKASLAKVKQEYIKLVNKMVNRFQNEIDSIRKKRMKELHRKKTNLKSTMEDIKKANDDVTQVIQSPYKMGVLSSHTTLSAKLKTFSKSQPEKADKKLGYVRFEAAIPSILNIGQLLKDEPGKSWKLVRQFSTGDLDNLHGLALDQDDNIVVCSWDKGVKVFTRSGDVKCTLYGSPGSVDVGVLPGKKYVSAPINTKAIKICNSQGKQAITCPITDVNNEASNVNSVTVDSNNKIIVSQVANTISIHNTDGSVISKFATEFMPLRLAATSNGDIVSSLKGGTSVQLMNYSGSSVRVIQPPDEVKVWEPEFVCCGQGEIFVSNQGSGDPSGVYRYTSEGDYIGCVTTQIRNPTGIALSRDGMELFVANYGDSHVKIFQRP